MIKNRSFESKFSSILAQKHEAKKFIKPKVFIEKSMMSVGSVIELSGYYKNKFENFFGVTLPRINIHKTLEATQKAKEYHAHSYAQGNNIYLGQDAKPIDTVEGQTIIAHEITHILQQKYLDMSSAKEMIDPSVELERKAQVVEDRVRAVGGIEKSSGDFFRKWDVLPTRSYGARNSNIGKFSDSRVVQRFGFDIDLGEIGASLVNATVNQAKNVGGALSEAGSTALSGVSSVGKYAASGYTGLVAEGADLLGHKDVANNFRKTTNTLQQSAIYDLNDASSHLSKSGKYGTNFLGSVVGNQEIFSESEIANTKGTVEELSPTWKKDDKYNKSLTHFGNQAIGAGLKGVEDLTGDFFTMKYGSWQYNRAKSYTDFMDGVGSGLEDFDKSHLQKNILTQTLSNSLKGTVDNTIIKPGQDLAKNLQEGKFIEMGTGLAQNANIASISMNSASGSLDGNITTLESNGIISKEQAEKFKVGKDTALSMTKLVFDIKNSRTKKEIANKRTNTLNQNIKNGKYTKNKVKGLLSVSKNAVNSANLKMLQSSFGILNEGAKGFDKYQGQKSSHFSKNTQFINTLVNNKINYKNLTSINKTSLVNGEVKPVQKRSIKNTLESTAEIGKKYGYGKFREEASDVYSPKNFFTVKENSEELDDNKKYTNQKIGIDPSTSSMLAPLGLMDFMSQSTDYKLVLSEMANDGLETYMERRGYPTGSDTKNLSVDYKLVFRGTWPSQFNKDTLKHDDKFDYRDVWEDAWERGQRQAESAKKIYRKYFLKEKAFFDLAPTPYKIKFNEMSFIGHSLGGYLANSTMVDFATKRSSYGGMKVNNIYAETYNALGLTDKENKSYKKYKKENPNKNILSINHRSEYDPVSKVGVQPDYIIEHKLKDKNHAFYSKVDKIIAAHSMDNFGNEEVYDEKYSGIEVKKDKASFFDKHIIDNKYVRKGILGSLGVAFLTNPITSTATALGIGVAGASAYYSSKGYEWASNKVVDGSRWLGNKAIGLKNSVVRGAKRSYDFGAKKLSQASDFVSNTVLNIKDSVLSGSKNAYDFGAEKISKVSNFVSNTASNVGNSISKGATNAYNFAEKKSKQFGSLLNSGVTNVSNTASNVGNSISKGAKNTYNFAEEKAEQFENTVSEGWDNVTDFFKFAEVNRHKQEPISKNINNSIRSSTSDTLNTMENQLDVLSMKIFRQLKNDIALEYARSGRN